MVPRAAKEPPTGPAWVHEPKVDGFRLQAVRDDRGVTLYSRNGSDFTSRYPAIAEAVVTLRGGPLTLDGEVVAIGADGRHDFRALMAARSRGGVRVEFHVFDVMVLRGVDLRERPLVERRAKLDALLRKAALPIRLVDQYDDGAALLVAADELRMEGIVSKRKASPYVSGTTRHWLKTKTTSWRLANEKRGELFEKQRVRC